MRLSLCSSANLAPFTPSPPSTRRRRRRRHHLWWLLLLLRVFAGTAKRNQTTS